MKILIIYHSGVGNTKNVAQWIKNSLETECCIEMYSVERIPRSINYSDFNGIIIGFPTIHTHPTTRIINFIDKLEFLKEPLPIFVYTTYGLYTANTTRIFCKKCLEKNLIPIQVSSYRCPATDGMLLVPRIKLFRTYEKNIKKRIAAESTFFFNMLLNQQMMKHIPRFKFYSILNYPNKLAGQLLTFQIYIHKDKCIKCDKCINHCPTKAMKKGDDDYPFFSKRVCEKCYRCIYNCPKKSLSIGLCNLLLHL